MDKVFSSRATRRLHENHPDSKHTQYNRSGTKIGSNTKKGKRAY